MRFHTKLLFYKYMEAYALEKYKVLSENKTPLDARFDLDGNSIVLHSRGGAKGKSNARNLEYKIALNSILERIEASSRLSLVDAYVDSSNVRNLDISARRVLHEDELVASAPEQLVLMQKRMKAVGQSPDIKIKGGNSTKKIRLVFDQSLSKEVIADVLKAVPFYDSKLSARQLSRVKADHLYRAVERLEQGFSEHGFSESTKYDLISDNHVRLDPKAVFGVAANEALGHYVGPEDFAAGDSSVSFRILRECGFNIVVKGQTPIIEPIPIDPDDEEWAEGKKYRVTHLRKERGRNLSKAKKASFKSKNNGILYCERCGLIPHEVFSSKHAEACIEVHHSKVTVKEMNENHRTKLEDLQCLCANCHRIVHREMSNSI